eukprot:1986896-Prymnesium_polylepis.1
MARLDDGPIGDDVLQRRVARRPRPAEPLRADGRGVACAQRARRLVANPAVEVDQDGEPLVAHLLRGRMRRATDGAQVDRGRLDPTVLDRPLLDRLGLVRGRVPYGLQPLVA